MNVVRPILLKLGAMGLLLSPLMATHPAHAETLQDIAQQLEVDTNEAYYLSVDSASGSYSEDEALGDMNLLREKAYDFNVSLETYGLNSNIVRDAYFDLNGAFIEALDSFRDLTAYNLYQDLFENIVDNMTSLRQFFERGYYTPLATIVVRHPRVHLYWYPYWRFPTHYHVHHLHIRHYSSPWVRYPHYREPHFKAPHRLRPRATDFRSRHNTWEREQRRQRRDVVRRERTHEPRRDGHEVNRPSQPSRDHDRNRGQDRARPDRPSRPSNGGGSTTRPSRPSQPSRDHDRNRGQDRARPDRPSRPSNGGGSTTRPSRPSSGGGSVSRPSKPSGGGGGSTARPSRPSSGSSKGSSGSSSRPRPRSGRPS